MKKMTNSENKYEARVREIAEEMANRHNEMCEAFDAEEAKVKPVFCDKFARIALKHMADQYRKGFDAGYFDRVADDVTSDEWLQVLGLIPSPTKQHKMKTIREWLGELPEPYRTQALENVVERNPFELAENIEQALWMAFSWMNSPQGGDYWCSLHDKLMVECYEQRKEAGEV